MANLRLNFCLILIHDETFLTLVLTPIGVYLGGPHVLDTCVAHLYVKISQAVLARRSQLIV